MNHRLQNVATAVSERMPGVEQTLTVSQTGTETLTLRGSHMTVVVMYAPSDGILWGRLQPNSAMDGDANLASTNETEMLAEIIEELRCYNELCRGCYPELQAYEIRWSRIERRTLTRRVVARTQDEALAEFTNGEADPQRWGEAGDYMFDGTDDILEVLAPVVVRVDDGVTAEESRCAHWRNRGAPQLHEAGRSTDSDSDLPWE